MNIHYDIMNCHNIVITSRLGRLPYFTPKQNKTKDFIRFHIIQKLYSYNMRLTKAFRV